MVKMFNVSVERSPSNYAYIYGYKYYIIFLILVCENNNEEEIRTIYDFPDNAKRIRLVHHFNHHRFEYDPDGLLGSNCTLQPPQDLP